LSKEKSESSGLSLTPVDFSASCLHTPTMSSALPPKPRIIGPRLRVCIVASKYNEQFADALVENAVAELSELMPQTRVDIIRVPGAFEIPVTIANILDHGEHLPACVIALGVIVKGATSHADMIGSSVTHSLQELSIKYKVPLIHEVLLVEDEKQAYARCIGSNLNRGREAARIAASMVDIFHEIERSMPRVISRNA
jgi:6,7-dimethyl-8-ribityllumazine synthase